MIVEQPSCMSCAWVVLQPRKADNVASADSFRTNVASGHLIEQIAATGISWNIINSCSVHVVRVQVIHTKCVCK